MLQRSTSLSFVVNQTRIVMEPLKINAVATWPVLRTFREI